MINLRKINELFDFEKGTLQSSKCVSGEYDFITAGAEWKKNKEYAYDKEALIVAVAASGSLGRVHYVNGKFISSDLCFILTPKDKNNLPIDLSFYFHVFKLFREDLVQKTATGTSKMAINQTNFGNYELPYFDIKHQNKYKSKLVKLASGKEELKDRLNSQKNTLKKLRQAILQDAIGGKLTADWRKKNSNIEPASELLKKIKAEKEKLITAKKIKREKPLPEINEKEVPFNLPKDWEWCRLGEVGVFERGKSKHRPRNDMRLFKNGNIPFVQTGDVAQSKKNNFQINSCNKYYNEIGLRQSRLWDENTLCITIAANIAETGFLKMKACFPDSVVGFNSLIDAFTSKYVQYYFEVSKKNIAKFAPATAQKNINLGIINLLLFPLPPLTEQKAIVVKMEGLIQGLDKLEAEISQNQKTADMLMQAVLKEAFEK